MVALTLLFVLPDRAYKAAPSPPRSSPANAPETRRRSSANPKEVDSAALGDEDSARERRSGAARVGVASCTSRQQPVAKGHDRAPPRRAHLPGCRTGHSLPRPATSGSGRSARLMAFDSESSLRTVLDQGALT